MQASICCARTSWRKPQRFLTARCKLTLNSKCACRTLPLCSQSRIVQDALHLRALVHLAAASPSAATASGRSSPLSAPFESKHAFGGGGGSKEGKASLPQSYSSDSFALALPGSARPRSGSISASASEALRKSARDAALALLGRIQFKRAERFWTQGELDLAKRCPAACC